MMHIEYFEPKRRVQKCNLEIELLLLALAVAVIKPVDIFRSSETQRSFVQKKITETADSRDPCF